MDVWRKFPVSVKWRVRWKSPRVRLSDQQAFFIQYLLDRQDRVSYNLTTNKHLFYQKDY
jgi:hypothetical protein